MSSSTSRQVDGCSVSGVNDQQMQQKPVGFSKIFSERTQRLIDILKNQCARRGSDASTAGKNDANYSTTNKKDYRRRQQCRKRRQECRRSIDVLDLVADNEVELKSAANVLYNDLIESKPPVDAYHSFLASLRQYFIRQTWSDCVETLLKQFLTKNVLLEASKLAEKYFKIVPLANKLDEYKFQVLLHLFTFQSNDCDDPTAFVLLDTVVNLLRMIDFMADHKILLEFLDEDVYETFIDVLPRHLAHLYEELGQPIPPELSSYANDICNEESFYEPIVIPSPMKNAPVLVESSKNFNEDSNHSCSSQGAKPLKRSQSWFDNKHHTMITVPSSGAKKLKLGKKKRVDDDEELLQEIKVIDKKPMKKSHRSLILGELASSSTAISSSKRKVARTPSSKRDNKVVPETPKFQQIPQSEKRRIKAKKMQAENGSRFVVTESPPRAWASVPVRQSPRQHASTKSLYSNVPALLTQLQIGADNLPSDLTCDGESDTYLSPTSPKFILIKAKKGYKFKSSTQKQNVSSNLSTLAKTPAKTPEIFSTYDEEEYASTSASTSSPVTRTKKNLAKSFLSPTPEEKSTNLNQSNSVTPLKLKLKRTESIESTKTNSRHSTSNRESRSNVVKRQNSITTSDYTLPAFAADNYFRYMTNIKKERNKPSKPGDDPFYARGTRRNSVFYENPNVSKCYTDEHKAPKNRSGRKMKSSVEFFHLANFLLNVKNKNPSSPVILRNLQRSVNAPIKLNKKLRLASKGGRKRAILQGKAPLSNTTSLSAADDDNTAFVEESWRKFHYSNDDVDDSQKKFKCARLGSTDTDCSEEFGSVLNPSTKLTTMKIVKTEIIDDCCEATSPSAYNLRIKKRTHSECDGGGSSTVGSSSKTTPSSSGSNINGVGNFHRQNIFEWAETSSSSLIEDDVFSSTSTANNYSRLLLNVNV